ncbi:hypothetical protein E1295_14725 [Nonomuraea mesophila]|uniref:Peptidase M16 N-terminal domain-containing protein n=1 Tax=Nonomuraea mesophila TaxID=2530382 RepID=A0A4R5FNS9_9ACTN|nr:hypothetical protein [Nonomuraea mesophila]TDE54645.1 hypothetical protein E1295_14725 [Nonomuraea mesophila]
MSAAQSRGFTLQAARALPAGTVALYTHAATGLRHVHVNTPADGFAVALAFATPTDEHAGVPHMLEHWMGCGSRDHPDRHLFPSLLAAGNVSFLNAFTGPDHLCLMAATPSREMAGVLASVLTDSAFRPLLDDHAFAEEAISVDGGAVRGVVWAEANARAGDPRPTTVDAAARVLYAPAAFRALRAQGNDPHELLQVRAEDARRYHAAYIRPERAWLLTVGSISASCFHRTVILDRPANSGPLPPAVPPVPELAPRIRRRDTGTAPHAVVAVPLERTADEGSVMRAQILAQTMIRDDRSDLRGVFARHGGVGISPATGVHTHYPHTILTAGAICPQRMEPMPVLSDLAEVLAGSPFGPDAIRATARAVLLDLRDRSGRTSPPEPWEVRLVLDAVGPIVHGADVLGAVDRERHVQEVIDDPDRVLALLPGDASRFARLTPAGHTSPPAPRHTSSPATGRASLPAPRHTSLPATGRASPPEPDWATPSARARATAGASLTRLLTMVTEAPAPCGPSRVDDELDVWNWRTDTQGVDHAVIDIVLNGLPDTMLPTVKSVGALFAAQRWRSVVEPVVRAAGGDVDRYDARLRITVTHHAEDASDVRAWVRQRLSYLENAPDQAVQACQRAGRRAGGPAAARRPHDAAVAQVSGSAAALYLVRHAPAAVDQDTVAELLRYLATQPRTIVITGDLTGPDEREAWRELGTTCRALPPDRLDPLKPDDTVVMAPGGAVLAFEGAEAVQRGSAAEIVTACLLRRRLYGTVRALGAHGSRVEPIWWLGAMTIAYVGTPDAHRALAQVMDAVKCAAEPSGSEISAARSAACNALVRTPPLATRAADALADDESRAALATGIDAVGTGEVRACLTRWSASRPAIVIGAPGGQAKEPSESR